MAIYVAFLRGMNVGGHRITNAELQAAFAELGLPDAATFRASGNVIFDGPGGASRDELRERIEAGLERTLGYSVPTFLRSGAETRAIAAHEPFTPEQLAATAGKLQVILLDSEPTAAVRRASLEHATDADRLAFRASELYWLPTAGISTSELDLDAVPALAEPATIRTMGTIAAIAAKHCAAGS